MTLKPTSLALAYCLLSLAGFLIASLIVGDVAPLLIDPALQKKVVTGFSLLAWFFFFSFLYWMFKAVRDDNWRGGLRIKLPRASTLRLPSRKGIRTWEPH